MSVTAVRNPYASAVAPRQTVDPRTNAGVAGGRAAPVQQERAQPALVPLARPTAAAAPERALPQEAPANVDPELWSVLSADERAFFAKAGAMGPLTYGRPGLGVAGAASPALPAPVALRGGRLDIRA